MYKWKGFLSMDTDKKCFMIMWKASFRPPKKKKKKGAWGSCVMVAHLSHASSPLVLTAYASLHWQWVCNFLTTAISWPTESSFLFGQQHFTSVNHGGHNSSGRKRKMIHWPMKELVERRIWYFPKQHDLYQPIWSQYSLISHPLTQQC